MANTNSDFSPSIFHPFYFIRRGLKRALINNARFMSGKMMDFGCGTKPYQALFNVKEYIGVDFYNEGHSHANEQIDFFYDGKKLPFENECFDSVLSSEVFEHIFNLNEILGEINRVMKKDGYILITCPFVWNEHEIPNDYARYTRFALQDILEKNGFTVVSYIKSGNFLTTVFKIWILYWYTLYHKKPKRFFIIRWLYKFFIILPSNLLGTVISNIFPFNDSLYLNNIMVARKNVSRV